MTKIDPSVGRIVWYWPSKKDLQSGFFFGGKPMRQFKGVVSGLQPFSAQIVYVWPNNSEVNLFVTDHEGQVHARHRVKLVQDDEASPRDAFCSWMPYQVGQAKKAETAEKAVPKPSPDEPRKNVGNRPSGSPAVKKAPSKAVKKAKKPS